ncbi:NAD(P)/FAD-dependent oxidoreductase [Desulfobulbus rhabdoformis]|uniref:NAD(P)/FAD-dependent oxidoreductase n=1 Tax=Desulfobulbus rhabdoformis TaxID=34032 RepID=UPI001963AFAA|nr:NAD(P)/FAD-dependent oxidoreductase [Desulfobulbus rhabdoformis]MBM9613324.1 NAD(P)/FAD-dependent oxidoreductase [Desulfobulbus rhabdoformis]
MKKMHAHTKQPAVVPGPRPRILVIGGGAAGLMAAGQAALSGAKVLVLEKMRLPGRKICITGKGRCNLTNVAPLPEFLGHFGPTGSFLRQIFHQFFTPELLFFFNELGLPTVTERGGRVFPKSGKAPEVLAVFQQWLKGLNVEIRTDTQVDALALHDQSISGVIVGKTMIPADRVILATGGASYPLTGSTGDGYKLAQQTGHTLVPTRPALVPIVTAGSVASELDGLQLRNILVRLFIAGKKKAEAFGELTFTDFGLSGPVILTLSGTVVDALRNKDEVYLLLDLKPALNEKKLDARLLRDLQNRQAETMQSVLRGLMPQKMVSVALQAVQIDPQQQAGTLRSQSRKKLRHWLKNFRLEVTAHRPLKEAIVTAGGVDTREVDPRTMESRRTPGLYFAGEVLDIQADTGGYNLQAAFSTGWLAGRAAAAAAGEER